MVIAATMALFGGCASDPFLSPGAERFSAPVELADTPFFPQQDYQCGPAALATVLVHADVEVTPDELVPIVWLPERRGSLQPEMLAASRRYGRIPYVLAPAFDALLAEVAAGHPVLTLQNLGIGPVPLWHYAVVVGFSPDEREVVLRSGEDRRRVTPAGVFARTWARADNWAMITLPPGALPAGDDVARYLRAVAAMEATGDVEGATMAYRAALRRWPDSHLAHLGLGNALLALGRADEAARQYRRALAVAPGDVTALNNLASVLATLGACGEAADFIERAEALSPPGSPLAGALADTRREVDACVPVSSGPEQTTPL